MKYFVGLIQELEPNNYKIYIFTRWILYYPDAEDTAVIDPSDILLNLSHPLVSGSGRGMVTMILTVDVSWYNRCFPHLR
jgi:hypothetical protein